MKHYLISFILLFFCTSLIEAQVPGRFDLRVPLKDKGKPLRDVQLDLQVEVVETLPKQSQKVVYMESYEDVWTNYDGYIPIKVGYGEKPKKGAFSDINWPAGYKAIRIKGRPAKSTNENEYKELYFAGLPTTAQAHIINPYFRPGIGRVEIFPNRSYPSIELKSLLSDRSPFIDFSNPVDEDYVARIRLGKGGDNRTLWFQSKTGEFTFERASNRIRLSTVSTAWIRLEGGNSAINFATAIGDNNRLGKISINEGSGKFEIQSINGAEMYVNSGSEPTEFRGSKQTFNASRHTFNGEVEFKAGIVGNTGYPAVHYYRWGPTSNTDNGSISLRNPGGDSYYNQIRISKLFSSAITDNYSIKTEGRIRAQSFDATSDGRIKVLVNPPVHLAIYETIMALEPVSFYYKDSIRFGSNLTLGFIAQDVEKILPQAVSNSSNIVPDIFQFANDIIFDSIEHSILVTLNELPEKPIHIGEKIQVLGSNPHLLEVMSINGTNLKLKNWLEGPIEELFIYGREVNDFRNIDYNQIFTLNVAATQELIKEVDSLKAQVTTLQDQQAELQQTNTELRAEMNVMQQQLNAITRQLALSTEEDNKPNK